MSMTRIIAEDSASVVRRMANKVRLRGWNRSLLEWHAGRVSAAAQIAEWDELLLSPDSRLVILAAANEVNFLSGEYLQ